MKKIEKIENINSLEDAAQFLLEKSDTFSDVMSNDALDWLDDEIGVWAEELKKVEHEISIRHEKSINQNLINRAIGLHFLIEHANWLYESSLSDAEYHLGEIDEYNKLDKSFFADLNCL